MIVSQGRKLVWECLSRDDELLHVAVYEWLVSKNLGSGKNLLYLLLYKIKTIVTELVLSSNGCQTVSYLYVVFCFAKV